MGSSPHTRGARRPPISQTVLAGIIPAYAGSTITAIWSPALTWDHPRIRGEHAAFAVPPIEVPGSSPHTRGARSGRRRRCDVPGIIPAYAGSTPRQARATCWLPDHPRIRGEHPQYTVKLPPIHGSSPHTRGARGNYFSAAMGRRIIPAYAGSTRSAPILMTLLADHPRIRGEHRLDIPWPQAMQGSSPHTRGAHLV